MSDMKAAWDEVGAGFTALGQRLKEHLDARRAAGEIPDRSQIDDALETLAEALERAVDAIGDSLRDSGVHDEARRAVASLGTALSATFSEIGETISRAFATWGRPDTGRSGTGESPPDPPTG